MIGCISYFKGTEMLGENAVYCLINIETVGHLVNLLTLIIVGSKFYLRLIILEYVYCHVTWLTDWE